MLVLQRSVNQGCTVGPVKIIVTRVDGNKINLGIDAPLDFKIKRLEDFKSPIELEQYCHAAMQQILNQDQ